MDMIAIEVTIAKLEVKAGDVLVLTCERHLSADQCAAIVQQAKTALPDGIKVLIVQSGLEVSHVITDSQG